MKKSIGIAALLVGILLVVYFVLAMAGILSFPAFLEKMLKRDETGETDQEKIVQMVTKTYPTDFVVFGKEIVFESEVSTRSIEQVTEQNLLRKENTKYTVLVLNDLDNSLSLSEEDIALLSDRIKTDGFCLIYLGEKYATVWDNPDEYSVDLKGNLWWEYYTADGADRRVVGAWFEDYNEETTTYPSMLGNTILSAVEAYLREIN